MNERIQVLLSSTVVVLLALFAFLAFQNIDVGAENIEQIQVFNLDEGAGTWQLKQNVLNRDFEPRGFYNYGYLYLNLTHLFVKVAGGLGYDSSDEQFLCICLRLASLISWLFLGIWTFLSCRNLKMRTYFSLLAAASIMLLPKVFEYAQFVHPDLLQMNLIAMGIFFLSRPQTRLLDISFSCLIFGLAFGTKYSGVFLLPLPFLMLLHQLRKGQMSLRSALLFGALGLVLFVGAWIASNPYVLSEWAAFAEDFKYESEHVSRGHWRAESANPLIWFNVIWSQFGPVLSFALLSAVILLFYFRTETRSESKLFVTLMLITLVIGLLYLMVQVNMRRPRYLFHLLPLMIIPGFYFLDKFQRLVKAKTVFLFLLPIVLIAPAAKSFDIYEGYSKKMEHEYIRAGEWMVKNYPGHIKILSDYYSYLPPEHFNNAYHTFGITASEIAGHQPQVIILNESISGMRSWKKEGTSFNEGKIIATDRDGAEELNQFHQMLFSNNSGWKVVYEEVNIVILEKELIQSQAGAE